MDNNDDIEDDDRTEEASPRRREKFTQEGRIVRSKEYGTFLVIMASVISMMIHSRNMCFYLMRLSTEIFEFQRDWLFDNGLYEEAISFSLQSIVLIIFPFVMTVFFIVLVLSNLVGGFHFNLDWVSVKFDKLDPVKNLGKIFSINTLYDIAKSFLKVILFGVFVYNILSSYWPSIVELNSMDEKLAIANGMSIMMRMVFFITIPFLIISLVDIPYEINKFEKSIRMTRQEAKDDYKETEGNPELKMKIKQLQRQVAERKMMESIPKSAVIVVNPKHYAVALKYDDSMRAPVVVAKGLDFMAIQIMKIAKKHEIPVVRIPPLARSLYHVCELDAEIPEGLYRACAQLLSFVYKLRNYMKHPNGTCPEPPRHVPIPEELSH